MRFALHVRSIALAATVIAPSAVPSTALAQPNTADDAIEQNQRPEEDLRGMTQAMFTFDVPAGSLRTVLDTIAAQSGSAWHSEQNTLPEVQSPGIHGYYTLHEAVVRALTDTGIRPVRVSRGEIRLAPDPGAAGAPDAVQLADIVVTARRATFKENYSSAATRTNTPLRQTPATIDAVTADILESRNAFSLGEALRNIPGAIYQAGGSPNQVRFGPQSTGGATFTNGLRNGALSDNVPTAMLDSVEVVKGPASILTGTQVGGGLVNYVPKRANGVTAPVFTVGGGSGGERLGSADVSAVTPFSDNLYIRLIAFAQRADENPAGGSDPYQYLLAPMLGYRSTDTTFDLGLQWSRQRIPFARRDYFPTAVVDGKTVRSGPIQSLRDLYNRDTLLETQYEQADYNFERNLFGDEDATVKFRARGLYQQGHREIAASAVSAAAGSNFVIGSISQYAPESSTSQAADIYARFRTGPIEHQLIVGADYADRHFERSYAAVVSVLPITGSALLAPIPRSAPRSDENSRQYGAFIQDQMDWGRWHFLLGLRRSWYDSDTRQAGAATTVKVESDKWTPTLGAVFDVSDKISTYVSYTEAFSPQTASTVAFNGDPLPPTLQKRYEVGIKSGLFDDRLDLNLSAFKVSTDNEARADPANPGFSIPGPGREEKGLQISAAGAITPTLKLTAGYTYTTGELITGANLDQAPENVANLWVMKTFNLTSRVKMDAGLGGNYYDNFYIGTGPAQVLFDRDYLSIDASLAVEIDDKLRLNATVSNLFNRDNYALSGGPLQLEAAPPRVFRVVLTKSF